MDEFDFFKNCLITFGITFLNSNVKKIVSNVHVRRSMVCA